MSGILPRYEARRWCSGDRAFTSWAPCTIEQAERYKKNESFEVRIIHPKKENEVDDGKR